jgi:hypothetical protein
MYAKNKLRRLLIRKNCAIQGRNVGSRLIGAHVQKAAVRPRQAERAEGADQGAGPGGKERARRGHNKGRPLKEIPIPVAECPPGPK